MSFTAQDIADALAGFGIVSEWGDTGGGVYNLLSYVTDSDGNVEFVVGVSDAGEWASGDFDTPADSVTVYLSDGFTGDSIVAELWSVVGLREWDDIAVTVANVPDVVRNVRSAIAYVGGAA